MYGRWLVALWAALLAVVMPGHSGAAPKVLRLATTTSTENSGLLAEILPLFEARTGYKVQVIPRGTGAALALGRKGDADVVLVHAKAHEERFIREGWGLFRLEPMYNDFVILGPKDDPAGIRAAKDLGDCMARLAHAAFVSRGDGSGTHIREQSLWRAAGVEHDPDGYLESGQGMGATLVLADEKQAYTLSDRGTYIAFADRIGLVVLFQGARELRNPYGIIPVNPARNPSVDVEGAKALAHWFCSEEAQGAIGSFRLEGEELFHPTGCPSLARHDAPAHATAGARPASPQPGLVRRPAEPSPADHAPEAAPGPSSTPHGDRGLHYERGGDSGVAFEKYREDRAGARDGRGVLARALELVVTGDTVLYRSLYISLTASAAATLLACLLGIPLGLWLAGSRFGGERLVHGVLNAAMGLPTVVIGLALFLLLSNRGPLGMLDLLMTRKAIALGEAVLVLPIVVALTISTVKAMDRRVGRTALGLGASRWQAAVAILREGRRSFLAVIAAAWGRAVGEVGIALILGGNIYHRELEYTTRTLTTAIATYSGMGLFSLALANGLVLFTVAVLLNVALQLLGPVGGPGRTGGR